MTSGRARMVLLLAPLASASWYAMQLTHELGHVLHAWFSGGRVVGVELPVLGFSRTIVEPNPHSEFVAVAGFVWGMLLPILIAGIALVWNRWRGAAWFFAGFCLLANGAYLLGGAIDPLGDVLDMNLAGPQRSVAGAVGGLMMGGGLWAWHSALSRVRRLESRPTTRQIAASWAALALTLGIALTLG